MSQWDSVYDFLQPKPPPYCPEEPSLTQKVFLRTTALEALFGGAAGGGKSSALLMAALQYVDVPGYTAILFRRTFADLALPGALMDRFREWMSAYDDVRWDSHTYTATFPSGARITFGYLNNKDDYLRYKGSNYQFVGMDEVTEIREFDYRYLFSRLRRPPSGPLSAVPLRMRAASNPAPNWVRQRFIVEGKEKGRIFIPSFLDDNPGVEADSYRQALSELDPIERRRLEHGDWWATTTGSMFNREDFITIDPHEIPAIQVAPKLVRYWDLAATDPTKKNDPDYTVGSLVMFDRGITYILDVKRFRANDKKVEDTIRATALEDGIEIPIRMDQDPGQAGKALAGHYARDVLAGFDFAAEPISGEKAVRARPFAAAVGNKNVKLLRGTWNSDFLDEFSSFPEECEHDDQVDATVGAFNFVTGIGGRHRSKVRIIV